MILRYKNALVVTLLLIVCMLQLCAQTVQPFAAFARLNDTST